MRLLLSSIHSSLLFILFVIVLLSSSSCSVAFQHDKTNSLLQIGTVYLNSQGEFYFTAGVLDVNNGVAFGSFNDTLDVSGWGVLNVATSSQFSDNDQMFAAGFLEGVVTANRIVEMYENINSVFFTNSSPSNDLLDFFKNQDSWTRTMIKSNDSDFWQGVSLIVAHYDGLLAGFTSVASQFPSVPLPWAIQMLNGVGDLLDLLNAIQPETRPKWTEMNTEEFLRTVNSRGRCSGLIKILGDYSDIFAAHSSWFVYQATNRIYKHYFFDLQSTFVAAQKLSFSSYPGFLESLDDFYIMDSGLIMVQTTNSIFNMSLYDLVVPQSLFAWQRVRLANMMAHSGQSWADIVAQYNSGTYNNQYMVLNTNLYTPGEPLLPNTFWVVEQIPGLVESADMTDILTRGYWPSYNVPSFERIYNLSGYPQMVEQYGVLISYQLAPRAQIFRRDQANVVDLTSLKYLMRYNDYENDPYSYGDPGNAICSRFDLESENPQAAGCYDTKVTSYSLSQQMISEAINGPTAQGLPPFSWTGQFANLTHLGDPQIYNFSFIQMQPDYNNWF